MTEKLLSKVELAADWSLSMAVNRMSLIGRKVGAGDRSAVYDFSSEEIVATLRLCDTILGAHHAKRDPPPSVMELSEVRDALGRVETVLTDHGKKTDELIERIDSNPPLDPDLEAHLRHDAPDQRVDITIPPGQGFRWPDGVERPDIPIETDDETKTARRDRCGGAISNQ